MSPISTMSTVSSVSSASSSGSSSRASLRSASIVSSCTIPLDEEDEDVSQDSSPSGTIQTARGFRNGRKRKVMLRAKLPEETECEEMARELLEDLEKAGRQEKKITGLFGELKKN